MSLLLDSSVDSISVAKGDVLYSENENPESFYIVMSGKVVCIKTNDKNVIPVFTAGPQDIIGEDCVLADESNYQYSAIALEDSELVKIDKSDVFEYLSSQSDWVGNILRSISEKITHTSHILAEHKIEDDKLTAGEDLTEEQEALLRNSLKL